MLLNHQRRTPHHWDDAVPSLCPDCQGPLLPRRGRVLVWHWAHRPAMPGTQRRGCTAMETTWHLLWKSVYHGFAGWEVEVPFPLGADVFRLDAARLSRGRVREFVHSLSEKYMCKHLALARAGLDVLWIFDGNVFVADRARRVRRGGIKHLLKPKARWLHARIGGLVHHDGQLWKEWKHDVWFPLRGGKPVELVQAFERHRAELEAQRIHEQGIAPRERLVTP